MTNQGTSSNPFELWQEMFKKSTEAWSQPAGPAAGFSPLSGFGSFQGSSPFPSQDPQQMWQQFFNSWSEFWTKNQANSAGPDVFKDAQKQWTEQLESMARTFAETMGSEAFSSMLGKSLEQSLTMQQRYSKEMKPHLDDALQAFNLPSRSQIDRLFERVIGLEEHLDDLEENTRKILKNLDNTTRDSSPRPKRGARSASSKQETPSASNE